MATELPGSAALGREWPQIVMRARSHALVGRHQGLISGRWLMAGSAPDHTTAEIQILLGGVWLWIYEVFGPPACPVIHSKAACSATVLTKAGNVGGYPNATA